MGTALGKMYPGDFISNNHAVATDKPNLRSFLRDYNPLNYGLLTRGWGNGLCGGLHGFSYGDAW
jgi:hypothetical protein